MRRKASLLLSAALFVLVGCATRQQDAATESPEQRPFGFCERELQPVSPQTRYNTPVSPNGPDALGAVGVHLIISGICLALR
jgi:hypothetical protein